MVVFGISSILMPMVSNCALSLNFDKMKLSVSAYGSCNLSMTVKLIVRSGRHETMTPTHDITKTNFADWLMRVFFFLEMAVLCFSSLGIESKLKHSE